MKFNLTFEWQKIFWAPLSWLIRVYIYFVGKTTRWTVRGDEHYWKLKEHNKRVIFVFWHNQLLMMPFFYSHYYQLKGVATLISRSRDGEMLNYIMQKFGYKNVRGSSSRGGAVALKELNRLMESGLDVVITPDGPRGPCYKFQSGAVALALLSGAPILPLSYHVKKCRRLRSWDRFKIPSPFNQGVFYIGRPYWVKSDLKDQDIEKCRIELEEVLKRLSEETEKTVSSF